MQHCGRSLSKELSRALGIKITNASDNLLLKELSKKWMGVEN